MRNHISHSISGFFSSKTLLLGVLIFAVLFLPLFVAQANPLSDALGSAIKNVVNPVLNIIFGFFATIFEGIFKTVAGFFMIVINYFMGLNVVPDPKLNTPPFVIQGWNISRQLINILFILILTFIGLATILRLQSYQLQKTLPGLIVIALLVNFSGVFVGFIVDIGTLIAKVFLDKVQGGWDFAGINFSESFTAQIARLIFYPIATLIFFIVMLLFAVRTMMLWTLVILAPLAFGAYVLPGTKKYWTQWLQQLIQWSIIGVPISFFMYFAKLALDMGAVGDAASLGAQLASFIAPFTALLLLFLGITLSMQLAPAGAQGVIDMGKKWGAKGALAAGSGLWRREIKGKTVGERFEGAGKWLQERGKAMEIAPQNANLLQKSLAAGAKFSGGGLIARWAGRNVEIGSRQIRMRVGDKDTREQKAAIAEVGDRDSFDIFSLVNEELNSLTLKGRPTNWNRITGLLNGVRARGDGDDIEDAFTKEDAPVKLDKKVLGKAVKVGQRIGPPGFRPLLKSFFGQVMLHPEQYGFEATSTRDAKTGELTFTGGDAQFLATQYKSVPTKYNAQDFQGDTIAPMNFNMDTEEGKFFAQTIAKTRGADFMGAIGRRPRKEESRKFLAYLFKEGEYAENGLGVDWLLDNNAEDVLRYLDSPGARTLGLGRGITRNQIEAMITQKGAGKTKRDLNEERARLEQERNDLTATAGPRTRETNQRINRTNARIQQIDDTTGRMDRPLAELQNEMEALQHEITEATNAIQGNENNLDAYHRKAVAERQLGPLQQELRRRGPQPTIEAQIYQDLTQIKQRLEQEFNQLSARAQELQNIVAPPGAAALGAPYDQAEQELHNLQGRIRELQEQISKTDAGLRVIEGIKIPEAPAPLPKIQPDMPSQLQDVIDRGNKIVQTIKETTQDMQKSLRGVHDNETDFNELLQEMESTQNQIAQLNREEQAGTLTPELQAQRDELRSKLQDLAQSRRDLGESIQQQTETTIRAKETIEARKTDLEDIRKQIEPLQEEYEGKKKQESKEEKIKQRQKQRKKS